MRFEDALPLVLGAEAGWSNHPQDRGGATMNGVTQAVYTAWRLHQGQPKRSVREMTVSERDALYRAWYWEAGRCGALPEPADYVHFDSMVQHRSAPQLLQRALGVREDGVLGSVTIAAARMVPGYYLAEDLLWVRVDYYTRMNDEQWRTFSRGWMNRMDSTVWPALRRYRPALAA